MMDHPHPDPLLSRERERINEIASRALVMTTGRIVSRALATSGRIKLIERSDSMSFPFRGMTNPGGLAR